MDEQRATPLIRFGLYEVDHRAQELRRAGRTVALQNQPFLLLSTLLERPGEVVSREELKARLWPNDGYGAFDLGINTAVRKLRQALGDSAENPRFIETLPKVGYRFVAPVGALPESAPKAETPAATHPPSNDKAPLQRRRRVWWVWATSAVVLVAAMSLLLWKEKRDASAPQRAGAVPAVRPLTTYKGVESDPSFSPGGSQVAFAWDGGVPGQADIYVKVVGGEKLTRLTTSPGQDIRPAWSPDGRWIAFVRFEQAGKPGSVYLISPLGGTAEKVAESADWVGWSPNSTSLLIGTPLDPGGGVIDAARVDTRERRRLTNPSGQWLTDRAGAISPDGASLAYVRCYPDNNDCDIFLMPTAGGDVRRLTRDRAAVNGLSWSGDSREIIFSSRRSGEDSLWRIKVSSGDVQPVPVVPSATRATSPVLSRTAQGMPVRLAFQQQVGYTNIWRTEIGDGGLGKIGLSSPFAPSTWGEVLPHYSPEGSRIAFMSKRSGVWQTWVADSDGENLRLIAGLAGRPNWSADGRWIAANCVEGPFEEFETREDICIASVGGGPVRRLVRSPKVETLPIWSRNGQWIYFTSDRVGDGLAVWRVDKDGGSLKRISPGPAVGGWESPDGKYVFYFKNLGPPPPRGRHTLWRMPVEGGQELPILEGVYPMFFSIQTKGIYFLSLAAPGSQAPDILKLYRWGKGDTVVIGELPKRVQRYPTALSVSPDGRHILTVHHEITGSDIIMVEDFR